MLHEKVSIPVSNYWYSEITLVDKFPIYNWIYYREMGKAKNPDPLPEEELTSCDFEFIDITGTAAVAKIHLTKGGKKTYTDYLSLYKFTEGWKIDK